MASPLDDDPYGDPELYDLEYAHHDEDVPWYVLQARRSGGPVLELGCGTGRLTLPIARSGIDVRGVDRAAEMVASLRTKLGTEAPEVAERVTLLEADYTAAGLGGPYGAVLWPFNALHHCDGPEQIVDVLRDLRTRIRPRGLLALDCYLPDLELYDRDPEAKYEPRHFRDPRSGRPMDSWEQGWWDAETHTHHVVYTYRHEDGRLERTHLRLRMYELDEVRELIQQAGWRLEHESSDFEGGPLGDRPLKYVAIAR